MTTNADGRFRLERFPAMELGLYFEKNGYATTSVLVPKGGASDLQIELPRGAMVTGKVHWPDGAEPTFVRILLAPPGAKRSIETETQIDGTAQEYVWYEDAETLFVDEDGTVYKNAIRPGTYIGYWVDEKQVSHEVGRWTFEPTKDYNVEIRLPTR